MRGMRQTGALAAIFCIAACLAACDGTATGPGGMDLAGMLPTSDMATVPATIPIKHVVIIVKENHTFDNYFGSFPGAEGISTCQLKDGTTFTCPHAPDRTPRDMCHEHSCALTDYNGGAMNGWEDVSGSDSGGDHLAWAQYGEGDIPNYWQYARHFTLGDHFFAGQLGPSFPGHMFTVAAQAGWASGNPNTQITHPYWGCDQDSSTLVDVEDATTCTTKQVFPCFKIPSLPDVLPSQSWKFYGTNFYIFPEVWSMFDAVDSYCTEEKYAEVDTKKLKTEDVKEVVDLCFQCKLCYPNCPYTPPHEFAIDFPRLLLRWKAQRVRREGVPLRARAMRDPAAIGRAASLVPQVANAALRNRANRLLMEKTIGVHRDKLMPTYTRDTFPRWWERHRPMLEPAEPLKEGIAEPTPMKVALFSTCLIDFNDPEVGRAAVAVLEHNGVEVVRPPEQVCCGMPFLDGGDLDGATALIQRNVTAFTPFVDQGYAIVVPSPSCSLMVREEFPQLLATAAAQRIAGAAHDLDAYLYRIGREGRLKRDFRRRFGRIQYHVPCHIRVQNVGIRGRDLLKLVADQVDAVQECSGHDGTWSMQREHFRDSLRWGEKAFAGMRATGDESCAIACTDCRLAALHIEQGAGRKTVHPIVALAHAYGFDIGTGLESKPVTA